ncbi:fibronectin type III domain-containing protein [Terrisporobacter mayombei]|uniref:Fibronectin type-III domain-containing protein n=1 Tax=Terrisporobacter mayombei TaxID=1541 RepID=A0ABY9PWH9_9FIRM|nr:hypothetical protein [Terrisporobacter mayombei]MCC3867878.1 hypothetical protein [Terrisporobacter mayombei]WMT80012.1 hypothetical protein TEMA_02860 [Terrisporobacter mayombei]
MRKKLKNILVVLLTLTVIMSNMGSLSHSFAQTNIEKQNITTDCKPNKVIDLRVTMKNSDCIKLEWNKVKGASGYRIYRSTMKNGFYRRIDEVCGKTTCYIDKELDSGTNYYYKVKAFKKVEDKICLGLPSDILDTTTCPPTVKNLHANCISNSFVELNWQTVYKSSGYEVYRASGESGNFTRVATLTDNGKSCYKDKNLKSRKKYYYKVRAFKELNGQVCFGDFSDVLTICTEK